MDAYQNRLFQKQTAGLSPMQFFCILLVALALASPSYADNESLISIAGGTSFGRCVGYCRQSVTLMTDPLQVITSREANYDQASYPPIHVRSSLSLTDWVKVANLVDLDVFQKLDERIGCPDCFDGGAEWVQISSQNGSKRVTFENGQTVRGIGTLIAALREMRDTYLSRV